jgi:hypothetical protein
MADGSEAAAGPATRDAEEEREWIPREIQAGSALELRIRLARERGSELERRIRDAEERMARAVGRWTETARSEKLSSREPEQPSRQMNRGPSNGMQRPKGTAASIATFE